MNRRRKAEHNTGQQRDGGCEAQNRRVQLGVEREPFLPVGEEQREQAHAPEGKADSNGTSDQGQHDAFDQQLPNHLPPSGTQAQPNGDLTAARRGA